MDITELHKPFGFYVLLRSLMREGDKELTLGLGIYTCVDIQDGVQLTIGSGKYQFNY
jgi:hypothetical protein